MILSARPGSISRFPLSDGPRASDSPRFAGLRPVAQSPCLRTQPDSGSRESCRAVAYLSLNPAVTAIVRYPVLGAPAHLDDVAWCVIGVQPREGFSPVFTAPQGRLA